MEKPGQAQTNSVVNWRNGGRIVTSEVIIKGILQSLIENSLIKVMCGHQISLLALIFTIISKVCL